MTMTDFAFVIECGHTEAPNLEYWAGCEVCGDGSVAQEWSKDPFEAVRFSRREDAVCVARALIDNDINPES